MFCVSGSKNFHVWHDLVLREKTTFFDMCGNSFLLKCDYFCLLCLDNLHSARGSMNTNTTKQRQKDASGRCCQKYYPWWKGYSEPAITRSQWLHRFDWSLALIGQIKNGMWQTPYWFSVGLKFLCSQTCTEQCNYLHNRTTSIIQISCTYGTRWRLCFQTFSVNQTH